MDILISEDNAASRHALKRTLEELGHRVFDTATGEDAWEFFQSAPVRVIVSDWKMPGMSGTELCAKVREYPGRSYVYFILLTAMTGEENYREAMKHGVDDFLPKPLDKTELAIRLEVCSRIVSFRNELNALKQIIPICSYCKSIRQDTEYWESVEEFLLKNLERDISHGICPDCYENVVEPSLHKLTAEYRKNHPDEAEDE